MLFSYYLSQYVSTFNEYVRILGSTPRAAGPVAGAATLKDIDFTSVRRRLCSRSFKKIRNVSYVPFVVNWTGKTPHGFESEGLLATTATVPVVAAAGAAFDTFRIFLKDLEH